MTYRTAVGCLSLLLATGVHAQMGNNSGTLLVAEKGARSLAIVDPAAGNVVASVPEGGITGHEVTSSPDGRFAYVPIYGNSGMGSRGPTVRTWLSSILPHTKSWATWISVIPYGRTSQPSDPKMACYTSPPNSTIL